MWDSVCVVSLELFLFILFFLLSSISFIDNSVFLCFWIEQVWFIVGSKGTEKSGRHSWYQSLGLVIT